MAAGLNSSAIRRTWLTLVGAAAIGSFALGAQTPTPPPAGQAPGTPPQGGAAGAPGAQGGGAGRGAAPGGPGRGRGLAGAPPINPNDVEFSPKPAVLAKTPAEEAKTFLLPPGYRMELVASDPDIISPSVIEFDGNGRMYVAEFVTYMPDADGNRQHDPVSRISRFESTKGDGVYDKHTVFADKLILPRMILPLDNNSILTNETDSDDVIKLTDTNGDGVADKKEVFYTGVGLGRDGNLEHEQSGFIWGLDNWIYSTYNAFRFRWTPTGILREPTGPNGGQWGLSMDDDGKPWFVDAGGERGPMNFQFPIQYGAFTATDGFETDFDRVWPIAGVADMQGSMGRVRMPLGVLNHLTAANGPAIVRGHRVPADLVGDLLFAEPVGRLVRRAKIVKTEGMTQLRNAYPGSEFLLSSDLCFRPVNIRTGPDGSIYIADMYHGIIQESTWTRPGSYLRRRIEQYQLDKVVDHGRIWRLRYDGVPAVTGIPTGAANATAIDERPAVPAIALDTTQPRMLNETAAQLVTHLTHPNGWWRDTAQRLLVLKQDKSVVPALQQMVRGVRPGSDPAVPGSDPGLTPRFHALWTLEGLGALDASLVREQLKDSNPRMRVQAIRASETLYKAGNKSFDADYRALTKDPDADVAIQAMLTLSVFGAKDLPDVVKAAQAANSARGVSVIGNQLVTMAANAAATTAARANLTPEQRDLMDRGGTIFTELCFTCHGNDGRGAPLAGAEPGVTMGPPLAGSPRVQGHRDYVIKVLLNGLTGPVGGKTYTEVMVPMGVNKDEWIAAIASYVRNSFGNVGPYVTPADVARVRAVTAARKTPWTSAEIEAALPHMLDSSPSAWKATSSHNTAAAAGALTLAGWTTGEPQQPNMWFQIDLPQPVMLTEIQFDSANTGRGGGPGRGGPPGAPAGAAPAGPAAPQVSPAGFPRGYRVQVSMDGTKWSTPIAEGKGAGARTVIAFKPVQAKSVRITQVDAVEGAPAWSILNLRLYEAAKPAGK